MRDTSAAWEAPAERIDLFVRAWDESQRDEILRRVAERLDEKMEEVRLQLDALIVSRV